MNCFSGWSIEGIWTKGGPVVAERCTIAGWKHSAVTAEDGAVGVELRNCLLAADGGKSGSMKGVTMVESEQSPDLAAAGIARPIEQWKGGDAELNSSKHPTRGYRAR